MRKQRLRRLAKTLLPEIVRRFLRSCLHYANRTGRWAVILWQVRGATYKDEWTLLVSALAAPLLSLKSLLEWQDPILLADADVIVSGVGKFRLRKRCDDLWHVLPWRERKVFGAICTLLRPGDLFVDAGANIGIYSLLAARIVGPKGRVISIEMIPETADRLEEHVRINQVSNLTIVRNALSDESGAQVLASVARGKYGQASLNERDAPEIVRVSVTTATLDEITNGIGTVRLMKMDIEGAELKALRGAGSLLQRLQYLIYESWGVARPSLATVDAAVRSAGFQLSELDGNNMLAFRQHAN